MLLDKIQADLKTALKEKDELQSSTLRFLLAAIREKEIELNKRGQLTDEDLVGVIKRQVKQHHESIEAYQKGKREELAEKEKKELVILNKYLPQQMAPEELEKIVKETIEQIGPSGPQDFGKVMGAVIGKVRGMADGKAVSELVKKLL